MKKVTIRWSWQELKALDEILTQVLVCSPDADPYERCAITVALVWQVKKLRPATTFPNPAGHKLSIDPATAFALKAILDFEEINPATLMGNRLLQLSDSIQQTFFSPIS